MEFTIKDPTFVNVGVYGPATTPPLVPNIVVSLDVPNCTGQSIALKPAASTDQQLLGVVVDKPRLDSVSQAVITGQGLTVRQMGHADVIVASAVAAGDHLSVAGTSGFVQTQARAAAGAQPVTCIGLALTGATAAGQTVTVDIVRHSF